MNKSNRFIDIIMAILAAIDSLWDNVNHICMQLVAPLAVVAAIIYIVTHIIH